MSRCELVESKGVRLREHVVAVDIGAERVTALLLDPFKPRLTTVDGEGFVKVTDYAQFAVLNKFSVHTQGLWERSLLLRSPAALSAYDLYFGDLQVPACPQ